MATLEAFRRVALVTDTSLVA